MFGMKGGYSDLWKAIIRPPRDEYTIEDLGPKEFKVQGRRVKRTDIELQNDRKLKIQCSHFEPVRRPCKELPCVIYMHGNCSSRVESLNCLDVLIPQNITLFALDFSGCGQSEGEYISLGFYEREDVAKIVEYLRQTGRTSTIGLWGRSMGAVTALMHADRDPSIAGLVLDSPFSSLRSLAEDLCKKYSSIPKFVMSAAMMFIKSTIKDKAKFDLDKLNPLENHVKKAFIPALFLAAKDDSFIEPKHTKKLHDSYAGDKNLIMVEGDHNTQRPQFALDSIGIFFYNTLQVQYLVPENGVYEDEKGISSKKSENLKDLNEIKRHDGKIGNDDLVQHALGGNLIVDDEDEEFNKAIEESLKAADQSVQKQKQQQGKSKKITIQQTSSVQPMGDEEANLSREEQKLQDFYDEDDDENQIVDNYQYQQQQNNLAQKQKEQQQKNFNQQQSDQYYGSDAYQQKQNSIQNKIQSQQNNVQEVNLIDFDDIQDSPDQNQQNKKNQNEQEQICDDLI